MAKQFIYNVKTNTYKVIDPMVPDVNNWKSSFKKFLINECTKNSFIEFPLKWFSNHKPDVKITFFESAQIHIYLMMKLRDDEKYRNGYCKLTGLSVESFKDYVNNWFGSTFDRLHDFNSSFFPSGYEPLTEIKLKGEQPYSIETYDANRLIYLPRAPFSVKIYSLLFHYNDSPRDPNLIMIYDALDNLVQSGVVSQKMYMDATRKFQKECSKWVSNKKKKSINK